MTHPCGIAAPRGHSPYYGIPTPRRHSPTAMTHPLPEGINPSYGIATPRGHLPCCGTATPRGHAPLLWDSHAYRITSPMVPLSLKDKPGVPSSHSGAGVPLGCCKTLGVWGRGKQISKNKVYIFKLHLYFERILAFVSY